MILNAVESAVKLMYLKERVINYSNELLLNIGSS